MHNAVMCTLSLYDVIGITRHLYIKLKSFSNIALPLHKEAVGGCSFLYIIAKKSVIMSEAFLVDVSICTMSHRASKYFLCYEIYIPHFSRLVSILRWPYNEGKIKSAIRCFCGSVFLARFCNSLWSVASRNRIIARLDFQVFARNLLFYFNF